MVYKYDLAPEPILAEAMHMSPPCRVSTHRSRVVDPDGAPTFLDHREAVPGIPHMTSLTKMLEHPDPLPIESAAPGKFESKRFCSDKKVILRWYVTFTRIFVVLYMKEPSHANSQTALSR